MRSTVLTCLLALSCISAPAQTAETIMARVAANQDASQSTRSHFIYVQHAHIASRKGNTIRCEETTDTRITPTGDTSAQQLLKLDGRILKKGTYITYTELPKDSSDHNNIDADHKDLSITAQNSDDDPMDQDLVENMRKNLTASHSKDGISPNLFPLTSKEQADYNFRLLSRAPMNGHDCFHIAFTPNDKNEFGWKGDAYIDATAFEPVLIRTTLSRKVPLAVRLLLGTNVPGLGFTIIYAPQSAATQSAAPQPEPLQHDASQPPSNPPSSQPNAVWFPVSFGTEFKIHVLFFLNRQITFTADNRDFELTHVHSQILDHPPPDTPQP